METLTVTPPQAAPFFADQADATVQEVLDRLHDRAGQPPTSNERRHERLPWVSNLTVWVQEKQRESPRELQVQTCDISRGGFSFTHSQFLYPNTVLYTRFDALPGQPVVVGVVANCIYQTKAIHRVGVRLLSAPKT